MTQHVTVRFFVSGPEGALAFAHTVPTATVEAGRALPRSADHFAFWRNATGDTRLSGHVLVWEPGEEQ